MINDKGLINGGLLCLGALLLGGCFSSSSGSSDDEEIAADTWGVAGQVSGLEGDQLILSLNGDEVISLGADGDFRFNTELEEGESYAVSASVLPEGPAQNCDFSNAEGTVGAADVDGIEVHCHAAVAMAGRVAGPVIADALLTAWVGDEEYQAEADEQGMYGIRLSVRDLDDMVVLSARDPVDDFVYFQSYLGSMEQLRSVATNDGLLTREQTVGVNVTNVTTAQAALMRWMNEGEAAAQ